MSQIHLMEQVMSTGDVNRWFQLSLSSRLLTIKKYKPYTHILVQSKQIKKKLTLKEALINWKSQTNTFALIYCYIIKIPLDYSLKNVVLTNCPHLFIIQNRRSNLLKKFIWMAIKNKFLAKKNQTRNSLDFSGKFQKYPAVYPKIISGTPDFKKRSH